MTRPHPFDVIATALGEAWFAEIQAASGGDLTDRLRFQQVAPVQRALGELAPAEAMGAAVEQYGTLLYAVYHFWRAGRHTLALDRAALDRSLERDAGTAPDVPHGACYVQLPERLLWARIGEATPPEPLDGICLTAGPGGREVTVLAVLGLRPERGGFSQIVVTAPPEDFTRAAQLVRRPLFAPVLEGGERAGVKSLVSEAELLHLVCLALIEVAR